MAQDSAAIDEAKRLAGEHWAWLGPFIERIYKDALVHGFKHGAAWQQKERPDE